jgi:hypothetical protein
MSIARSVLAIVGGGLLGWSLGGGIEMIGPNLGARIVITGIGFGLGLGMLVAARAPAPPADSPGGQAR